MGLSHLVIQFTETKTICSVLDGVSCALQCRVSRRTASHELRDVAGIAPIAGVGPVAAQPIAPEAATSGAAEPSSAGADPQAAAGHA